jgi:flagellar biosynthesis/type III secretory pathway protein FliH
VERFCSPMPLTLTVLLGARTSSMKIEGARWVVAHAAHEGHDQGMKMARAKGRAIHTGTVPGQVGRRTKNANERLAALIARLESEGCEPAKAKEKALEIMKDNPRGDWRAG